MRNAQRHASGRSNRGCRHGRLQWRLVAVLVTAALTLQGFLNGNEAALNRGHPGVETLNSNICGLRSVKKHSRSCESSEAGRNPIHEWNLLQIYIPYKRKFNIC